jgi:ABC-type hemin transport system substrate-binding protein
MGKADISVQQQQSETFWSQWPGLQAVKNKKVYVIDSDMVLRLGPRLPQGIEMVGHRLYPDATIKHNETE